MVRGLMNRRFGQLNVVAGIDSVEAAFRQRESADTLILRAGAVVVITSDERVARVDRVIETRTEEDVSARHDESLAKLDAC